MKFFLIGMFHFKGVELFSLTTSVSYIFSPCLFSSSYSKLKLVKLTSSDILCYPKHKSVNILYFFNFVFKSDIIA
jgi:hypothetical protein